MQNSKLLWFVVLVIGAAIVAGVWSGFGEVERRRANAFYREADALVAAGDHDAALIKLNQGIRIRPHAAAYRVRAGIHMRRNERSEALSDLNAAISRERDNAWAYHTRCSLRLDTDATLDAAREDCDRAIELDPSLAGAFGSRGVINLKQRRFPEAWEDFDEALRLGGRDQWRGWRAFGRGVAAWEQGRTTEGRQDIELARRLTPGVEEQFSSLGIGAEIMQALDAAAYEAASSRDTARAYQTYLENYPAGAHAETARARLAAMPPPPTPSPLLGFRRGPSGLRGESYGAIAVWRSTRRGAFVTDYPTRAQAERAATDICAANAGSSSDCAVSWFRNACGAFALDASNRIWATDWGNTQEEAMQKALSSCQRRGGGQCQIAHSQCTPTRN